MQLPFMILSKLEQDFLRHDTNKHMGEVTGPFKIFNTNFWDISSMWYIAYQLLKRAGNNINTQKCNIIKVSKNILHD